jgi:hypothetical protein
MSSAYSLKKHLFVAQLKDYAIEQFHLKTESLFISWGSFYNEYLRFNDDKFTARLQGLRSTNQHWQKYGQPMAKMLWEAQIMVVPVSAKILERQIRMPDDSHREDLKQGALLDLKTDVLPRKKKCKKIILPGLKHNSHPDRNKQLTDEWYRNTIPNGNNMTIGFVSFPVFPPGDPRTNHPLFRAYIERQVNLSGTYSKSAKTKYDKGLRLGQLSQEEYATLIHQHHELVNKPFANDQPLPPNPLALSEEKDKDKDKEQKEGE